MSYLVYVAYGDYEDNNYYCNTYEEAVYYVKMQDKKIYCGIYKIVAEKDEYSDEIKKIETQEQGKALDIIKNKRLDMWHIMDLLDQTYDMYLAFCKSEEYADDYILTREEFDLLKEINNGNS